MYKRISALVLTVFVATFSVFAQTPNFESFDPNYRITFNNPTQDKNFYVLSLMQNLSDVRNDLRKNKTLKLSAKQHFRSLQNSRTCNDVKCYDQVFRLTDAEVDTIARTFENSPKNKSLTKLVVNHLRPSGMFIRYDAKSDTELLALAWRDAAKGLNHILDVYGLGKDAKYKDIDNVGYDVHSIEYQNILKSKVAEIKLNKDVLFFEPTLAFAMKLLEANKRDEAGRHEPLEAKDNRKAVENIKNIIWNDYPYSVILVLGSGPGNSGLNISKVGMNRADEAVKLFHDKQAPLIILSGGYVHPAQTPYSEAVEMKKYIIEKYGISESNILIEPHARHTTTNVRNASRIMLRFGIPTDKMGLISSSETHIDYVAGDAFKKRLIDEIGYVPMQIFKRISPIAIEFVPLEDSLFVNSMEMLDP